MRSNLPLTSEQLPDCAGKSNWKAYRHVIHNLLPPIPIPDLVLADEPNPLSLVSSTSEIDITGLGVIRAAHETHFAKKAIRVGALKPEHSITAVSDNDAMPQDTPSKRQKLVKTIYASLRSLDESLGAGTGAVRRLHHKGKVSTAPAGNSANAEIAAKQRSNAVWEIS